ncbi:2-(1,2-epoxy-1,2-dihydrophenyl)acetyl-CoA isomerase [Lewinellaceae bacterium SD302]|nr:2-(1,2-epoxy-1,2-dihydrophenyl)acetyl-CoA isomerase [Lewinellaceae bacterium SD302]
MQAKTTILARHENGVAYLTLNRPDVFNSFNREMALELQQHLDNCAASDTVRAVVLTGAGKAFCAGQDLKEVTTPELNPGFRKILDEHYAPIITRLRQLPKPVVAAVNGVAAGAGANIALACDIIMADEGASFIQAFSKIGLVPDSGGTFFLPRIVGFQKAMALAMLGDKVSARDAEKMGMIYRAVPSETFTETVEKTATKLAMMPTRALGLIKQAFHASQGNSLEQQLELEANCQIEASETEDYQEGVTAFLEKRKPNYRGR